MTRQEAIEHGKEQLEIFGGEHREFIKIALEALEEQRTGQNVLDKIRAEIMSKDGLEEALEIIDKYKAESEDK